MTEKTYYLSDPRNLDIQFYHGYDEAFLIRKAETLLRLVDNVEKYRSAILEGDDNNFDKKKFIESLNAEIHFTEFHQFEAFFAILIAGFQNLPHWLFLTTYTSHELKLKINSFLKNDFLSVSNGLVDNPQDFINSAVYAGYLSDDENITQNWQQNLEDIFWYINRIARKYIDSTEFNAYKHGLRVITGPSYIEFIPTGKPDQTFHYESDNSIRFLELDEVKKNTFRVKETYKHFNPLESFNHLYFMCGALEIMKSVRLARINGEKKANIKFLTLDKANLNKLSNMTKWSVTL